MEPEVTDFNELLKGRKKRGPRSEETKKKISEARKGVERSEEVRRKISEGMRERWAKKKQIGIDIKIN